MRHGVAFLIGSVALFGLSARADYMFVKIDLSQVYQNMPSMSGVGFNPKGFPGPGPGPGPNPFPEVGSKPGDGPFVYATIEIKSKLEFDGAKVGKKDPPPKTGAHLFDHAWGKKGRFVTTPTLTPAIIKYTQIARDPLPKQFDTLFGRKELAATKDANKLLTAARWALRHGQTADFHGVMAILAKVDPKNAAAVNYQRVTQALRKPPTADDPALKGVLADLTGGGEQRYHLVNGDSGFYLAYTNLPGSQFDDGVKRRLARLQATLENFYYWFALNDDLLQPVMPPYRQVLVVTSSVDEFHAKHAEWGSQPFSGDGVTARRDNFILMSWRPIDDVYKYFDANNQELWKKLQIPKDWLVTGSIWEPGRIPQGTQIDPYHVAFAQTLTLVQKAMEEDAEISTLTREGARQLLFASGILPRHVHTPEWIAQGLASYFETAAGAPYGGVGLPSWSNLVNLTYMKAQKKFDSPTDALTHVYTDRYFRAAQKLLAEQADVQDKAKLNDRIREEIDLADCTAWAFTYYMIERRKQPQLLFRYCQELNALPRDLDLDGRTLEACFARVFDLADKKTPLRIDSAKLTALADSWASDMAGVSLELPELQNEYLDLRRKLARKK